MKQLFFALFIGAVLLASFVAAAAGAGIMIYDVINHGNQFMKGFELCGIGTAVFVVTISAYILCEVQKKQQETATALGDFIQYDMHREDEFRHMFQMMSLMNGQKQNEDEDHFEDENHRDQIIAQGMGLKLENAKRRLELMTMDELQQERARAVSEQQYEYASAIRDVIAKKKG